MLNKNKRLLNISAVLASLALVFGLSASHAFAQENVVTNSDDGSTITTDNGENVVTSDMSNESTVTTDESSVSTDDGTALESSTEGNESLANTTDDGITLNSSTVENGEGVVMSSDETTPPIVYNGYITDYGRSLGYTQVSDEGNPI